MEKKERKRLCGKLRIACLVCFAALLVSFGTTWAFYSDQASLVNPLGTSHSGVVMAEEFNPNDSFLPGETVTKKLWFENTGEMDLFLRVEVPPAESWVDNPGLDTTYVIKGWTNAWTENKQTINGAEEPAQDFKDGSGGTTGWGQTNQWSKVFTVTDGTGTHYYRYYRKVLKAKDQTDAILETIKLSPEVSNDRHADDYSGKIYKLSFKAEAVPVENPGEVTNQTQSLGVQAEWNMKVTLNTETELLNWDVQN